MNTRQSIEPIFQQALDLLEKRESLYGDSWRSSGGTACVRQMFEKIHQIDAYYHSHAAHPEHLPEDLLDLINLVAFVYWHIENIAESVQEANT